MRDPIFLIGGGGHGRVVLDAALLCGLNIVGIIDPTLPKGSSIFGISVVGGDDDAPEILSGWINGVGAIGSTTLRHTVFDRLVSRGPAIVLIHPSAVVAREVDVRQGAQIMAGAVVQTGVSVAENAVVNTGARIDHDCILGAHAFISPAATLCGGVIIGEGSFIGAGAVILPSVTIGENCIIGAGAVVTRSIPSNQKVVGTPAKPI